MTKINPRERSALLVEHGISAGTQRSRTFGLWLRATREERGRTRAEVAGKIGVSTTVYGSWETGSGVPGERSMIGLRRWLGKAGAASMDGVVRSIGEAVTETAKAFESRTIRSAEQTREDMGLRLWEASVEEAAKTPTGPAPGRKRLARAAQERADAADDRLLEAVIGSSLTARHKALLSAAVVALLAGIEVEVEIRAKV